MARFGYITAVTALAASLSFQGTTVSAGNGAIDFGQRIATAVQFMSESYSDVLAVPGVVQITSRLLEGMRARELGVQFGAESLVRSGDLKEAQCYGRFRFSAFGLLEYSAKGKCVSEAENSSFRQLLDEHSDWSDERVISELLRRGAQFGPDARDRIEDRIPPEQMVSALTGELASGRQVEFRVPWRQNGKMTDSYVEWRITYDVPGKQHVNVVAILEPFQGRVRYLARSPAEEEWAAIELPNMRLHPTAADARLR